MITSRGTIPIFVITIAISSSRPSLHGWKAYSGQEIRTSFGIASRFTCRPRNTYYVCTVGIQSTEAGIAEDGRLRHPFFCIIIFHPSFSF